MLTRTVLTAALALATIGITGGCTQVGPRAATSAASTSTTSVYDGDTVFEITLAKRGFTPTLTEASKSFGHSICTQLGRGDSLVSIVRELAGYGHPEHFGNVIGAAIPAYCPQYLDQLARLP